jgi:hypothetical protein
MRVSEIYKRVELALAPRKFVRHKKCGECAVLKENSVQFEAVSILKLLYAWRVARRILPNLKFVLNIDIGGGSGYLVYILSKLGVKRVLAIEIMKCLHLQAQDNLSTEIAEGLIELQNADVRDVRFPHADLKVFWIFNPFIGQMFSDFVKQLHSLENVYILYINDVERDVLNSTAELLHRSKFLKVSMFSINVREL